MELVLNAKKISFCTDEEIKEVLRYAMLLVGIRANTVSVMSGIEKSVLIDFVRNNYKGHTRDEVKLAFYKAVSRDLKISEKDINAYENFSCEYIGKIMNAYRLWASDYYRESGLEVKQLNSVQNLLPPANYNPIEWVGECYKDFLLNKLDAETLPERVYDIANENGLFIFKDDKLLSIVNGAKGHVLNKYHEKVKELNPNKKLGEYNEYKQKIETLSALNNWQCVRDVYVNRYAKAIALRVYFYELKYLGVIDLLKNDMTLCLF